MSTAALIVWCLFVQAVYQDVPREQDTTRGMMFHSAEIEEVLRLKWNPGSPENGPPDEVHLTSGTGMRIFVDGAEVSGWVFGGLNEPAVSAGEEVGIFFGPDPDRPTLSITEEIHTGDSNGRLSLGPEFTLLTVEPLDRGWLLTVHAPLGRVRKYALRTAEEVFREIGREMETGKGALTQ